MSEAGIAGIKVPELPRNHFDRSNKLVGSYKTGYLYPIEAKIMKPNDTVNIVVESVVRRLPTISPSFAEERVVFRWFIVPLRLLYKNFPQWLTGIKEYTEDIPFTEDVPRWVVQDPEKTKAGSLWEALGYPVNCIPTKMPADFKRQAYAYVYDTFFRYKPIQQSILDEQQPGTWRGEDLLKVIRDRDYFTTGLPNQQLGEPVALPITGDTTAIFDKEAIKGAISVEPTPITTGYQTSIGTDTTNSFKVLGTQNSWNNLGIEGLVSILNKNKISMTNISSATISMIRHAAARQIQAENLARSGVMYTDVLTLNWGDAPSDEILGLPSYIGGSTIQIINSEVLQTSASVEGQPLGQMGGHGMGVGTSDKITAHSKEFSVLLGLMYIKTENMYGSQQMPEEDMFRDNESVPWIAYANLSEQPVKKQEILCASKKIIYEGPTGSRMIGNDDNTAEEYNEETFMYQPIYEHWRRAYSKTFGLMTQEQIYTDQAGTNVKIINNLYNWTEARFFSIKNGERPAFNSDFLEQKGDNRNYSVTDSNKVSKTLASDNFIIWINKKEDWYSVMDLLGTPGGTDHFGIGGVQI